MRQIVDAGATPVIAIGLENFDRGQLGRAREERRDAPGVFTGDQAATAEAARRITGLDGTNEIVDGGGTAESMPLALEIAAPPHGQRCSCVGAGC